MYVAAAVLVLLGLTKSVPKLNSLRWLVPVTFVTGAALIEGWQRVVLATLALTALAALLHGSRSRGRSTGTVP